MNEVSLSSRWMCQDSSLLGEAYCIAGVESTLSVSLLPPPGAHLTAASLRHSPFLPPSFLLPQSRDCNLGRSTTPSPNLITVATVRPRSRERMY